MQAALNTPCALRIVAACGLTVITLATTARPQSPAAPSEKFEFKDIDDKSLGLWEGDKPVFVYNHGQMTLPGNRRATPRSSYLHPIYGLEGEVLTDDFPRDHYHHHGLFWGWPHVKIGDREYDLWSNRGIRIEFEDSQKNLAADKAELSVRNGWHVRDKKVMQEQVSFVVHPATEGGRIIDAMFEWTPTDEPITLSGAEGKSYGGLTLRFAPRTDTVITTPTGRVGEDLLITRLPWADLAARFQGASGPSGAAIFVSPTHPDFPPEWMTRDYGVLAVGWPGVQSQTFEPGKSIVCRYRVWIHRGAPDVAALQKQFDAYQASAKHSE